MTAPGGKSGAESSKEDRRHHEVVDPHVRGRWLADVVLGGQDGLVNVLGVVLGVAAASESTRLTLVAGLAAAVAESISMAAVAFTSRGAEADLYRAERQREYRHVERVPALERDEVRAIYERKGFSGELLEQVVDTITRNKDVWVDDMMTAEHRLSDVDAGSRARSAVIVGGSALLGSLLPLAPYLFFSNVAASWAAIGVGAAVLFAFGHYKARSTTGNPARSGIELALIGVATALAGYAVGWALRVPAAP